MALDAGTRLGPYEVLTLLGAGGMGEVYLARDARLEREVAVKVLPAGRAVDALAVERFRREAHAVAGLNHPNICSIHDVGEHEGAPFLVMEYLDGETLAGRLTRGPFDAGAWLEVGLALSDALAAAHAAGVIHRDVKPANIFLTRRGGPKILDFGLAKAVARPDMSTSSRDVLTMPGAAAGTIAYMSPEQLRGEELDQRSDIFSLGLVLYEMATGRRAFAGGTSALVATAILNEEPSGPRTLRADLDPELDRIVLKTLEKDRDLRYQSAADLRTDLKRLRRDTAHRPPTFRSSDPRVPLDSSGPAVSSPARDQTIVGGQTSRRQLWPSLRGGRGLVVTVLIALLVTAVAIAVRRGRPIVPSLGSTVFPHLLLQPLTFSGDVRFPAISPDGRFVAFLRQDALWIRQVSAASADQDVLLVPRVEGRTYRQPTITPDGEHVDFVAVQGGTRELWRVALLGGSPRPIVSSTLSAIGWSPDGKTMAFVRLEQQRTALVAADADGSNQRVLLSGEPARRFKDARPAWSTDGGEILVVAGSYSPASGDPQMSELVFVDARSGAVLRRHPTGHREVRAARWLDRGRLIVETGQGFFTTLWATNLRGEEWTPLTREFASLGDFDATADRNTGVATRRERRTGIWSVETAGGISRPVVAENGSGPGYPTLDESGGVLYSALLNDGSFGVYRIAPNDTRSVLVARGLLAPDTWATTRDGRVIVFTGESTYPLRRVNVDGSGLAHARPG
jgi:eukaryotic-like serine/threonine-protein kinase